MKILRCPGCGRREKRSSDANKRYWLLLHEIEMGHKPGGITYSKDTWHLHFKSIWIGRDDITLPTGEVLTIPRSSAALDVSEFGDYMTKIEAWAAERDVFLDEIENAA